MQELHWTYSRYTGTTDFRSSENPEHFIRSGELESLLESITDNESINAYPEQRYVEGAIIILSKDSQEYKLLMGKK